MTAPDPQDRLRFRLRLGDEVLLDQLVTGKAPEVAATQAAELARLAAVANPGRPIVLEVMDPDGVISPADEWVQVGEVRHDVRPD